MPQHAPAAEELFVRLYFCSAAQVFNLLFHLYYYSFPNTFSLSQPLFLFAGHVYVDARYWHFVLNSSEPFVRQ